MRMKLIFLRDIPRQIFLEKSQRSSSSPLVFLAEVDQRSKIIKLNILLKGFFLRRKRKKNIFHKFFVSIVDSENPFSELFSHKIAQEKVVARELSWLEIN